MTTIVLQSRAGMI